VSEKKTLSLPSFLMKLIGSSFVKSLKRLLTETSIYNVKWNNTSKIKVAQYLCFYIKTKWKNISKSWFHRTAGFRTAKSCPRIMRNMNGSFDRTHVFDNLAIESTIRKHSA
jgi:hypothetical protein